MSSRRGGRDERRLVHLRNGWGAIWFDGMSLRFNFHFPEAKGPDADLFQAGDIAAVAAAAERSGFDGFSLSDHPIPSDQWLRTSGHQTLDPLVGLAFAAGSTERLRLITHLLVAPYRQPFLLAKAAATLDTLSHGRLTLGMGAGYMTSEYTALGVSFDERNVLFDEALDVLPRHWSGAPFSYSGSHFTADDVTARPAPPQQPIPIWIGGNSPLSRRRVAAKAQGWMPMIGGPAVSAAARTSPIATLAEGAAHITAVKESAVAAGRTDVLDFMVPYFADGSVLREPERHRDALAELEEAGITWVTVSTRAVDFAATSDFLAGFGELYIDLSGDVKSANVTA
ncbi:MAG TPA: TIGR03619 family F420-dependent LLM class oxidoreductase [Ilumatobacteraceae bacterium]